MLPLLLLCLGARAEVGGLDAHGFSVAGNPGDPRGYLEIFYPDSGWPGAWDAGVVFDYADNPLVERVGDRTYPVLDQVLAANLVGGMSILGAARVDLVLPVYLVGQDQLGGFSALGDARLSGNIPFTRVEGLRPGVSLVPELWFPTGADVHYLGDKGVGFGAMVAVAEEVGPVGLALNLGGRVGQKQEVRNVEWGTGLLAGLGASYRIDDRTSVAAELHATPSYGFSGAQFPMEALLHGRIRLPMGLYAMVGGGGGLTSGVGASRYRLVTGVGWSEPGEKPEEDLDGDGVGDKTDRCPRDEEDYDGFQDGDGCPDSDNDRDGVYDTTDKCPNDPEDDDEIQDEDGCVELDADQDGIPDGSDRCPLAPEDMDGHDDTDGCAEEEGDMDGDGVPDHRDACPDQPIRAGQNPKTSDGCPKLAEISDNKIVITDLIYFEEGKSRILPESTAVLDAVATVLRENPGITDLLIEGHTNDVGEDAYNYKLSEARAKAVMDWLIGRGVDRNRLASKGYGETRPIVPNDTEEGRAVNRRVEFTIITRVKE